MLGEQMLSMLVSGSCHWHPAIFLSQKDCSFERERFDFLGTGWEGGQVVRTRGQKVPWAGDDGTWKATKAKRSQQRAHGEENEIRLIRKSRESICRRTGAPTGLRYAPRFADVLQDGIPLFVLGLFVLLGAARLRRPHRA